MAAAVSGGADSVALLRLLLEARGELGIVLSVAHFHHGIRGGDADSDAQFVAGLAKQHGLPLELGRGDAPAYAKQQGCSLETAARDLRHKFFAELVQQGKADVVATAHTLDDQAETVLMRLLRGAGTRGLSGIFPSQPENFVIRPLLAFRRSAVEAYLQSLGQAWREDESNRDLKHSRNRVRHQVMPLLQSELNPNLQQTLANMAETARAEEDFWRAEVDKLLPFVLLPGKPVRGGGRAASTFGGLPQAVNLDMLLKQPLALQRRLLRRWMEEQNIETDSGHVESALQVARRQAHSCELPGGWQLSRSFRELRLGSAAAEKFAGYEFDLPVPGSVRMMNIVVHVRLEEQPAKGASYNSAVLSLQGDAARLTLRNWRAGDRFQPAFSRSEKKLKELLQEAQVPQPERAAWPVVEHQGRIVWVRGLRNPELQWNGKRLAIEEEISEDDI